MTRNSYLTIAFAGIAFLIIASRGASAETVNKDSNSRSDASSSNENPDSRPVAEDKRGNPDIKTQLLLQERKGVPFLEKPGSGWIIGSIPVLTLGTVATVAGTVWLATPANCKSGEEFCGIGNTIGLITLIPALAVAAGGAAMVGYGVVQNKKFADGTMDYVSPATGYIAGGAINAAIGLGAMIAGGVATSPTSEGGIYLLAGGSVFAAYGLAFGLYGGIKDFSRNSKQSAIENTFRSLTPYIGCAGGMCDGNTSRATGREIYFGGLRGEF